MKTKLFASFVAALTFLSTLHAQDTAFTYQGRLNSDGNAANGTYDLTFALFDVSNGAGQVGSTITNTPVEVTNGLFTVTLDFGTNFPGADRWLEIGVRTNGGEAFSTLSPRQKITPTPYAITAGAVAGTIPLAQLPATLVTNGASGVNFSGTFSGDGSNITGLAFVRTNETRPIINTESISSSNTMTASNFVSTIYQAQDAQMLALNYYPESTNYLMYRSGQLAFAPSAWGGPDNGLVWGSSYLRLGDGATDYAFLLRGNGSMGFEHVGNFGQIRIGDDHRLDQMLEMSAGTIPGTEVDSPDTYGIGGRSSVRIYLRCAPTTQITITAGSVCNQSIRTSPRFIGRNRGQAWERPRFELTGHCLQDYQMNLADGR